MIQATKKIIINGGKQTTVEDYQLICKRSRAGKNGKQIVCPECESIRRVYHFNFSGLTCPECKQSVDKYRWKVLTVQGQLGSDSNNNRRTN